MFQDEGILCQIGYFSVRSSEDIHKVAGRVYPRRAIEEACIPQCHLIILMPLSHVT